MVRSSLPLAGGIRNGGTTALPGARGGHNPNDTLHLMEHETNELLPL